MGITAGIDVTSTFLNVAPKGIQLCLYVTGSNGIPATAAQLAANPNAVLIVQSPVVSPWDKTGDVIDYESGAVLLSELVPFVKEMQASFHAGTRPGQREPAIYASQSNIAAVTNELRNGGITSGVYLWVADWNLSEPQAVAEILKNAAGYPIIGVQYHNAGAYDLDVFDTGWLDKRSGTPVNPPVVKPATPPGQWANAKTWEWKEVSIVGIGLDGNEHIFTFDTAKNVWTRLS